MHKLTHHELKPRKLIPQIKLQHSNVRLDRWMSPDQWERTNQGWFLVAHWHSGWILPSSGSLGSSKEVIASKFLEEVSIPEGNRELPRMKAPFSLIFISFYRHKALMSAVGLLACFINGCARSASSCTGWLHLSPPSPHAFCSYQHPQLLVHARLIGFSGFEFHHGRPCSHAHLVINLLSACGPCKGKQSLINKTSLIRG